MTNNEKHQHGKWTHPPEDDNATTNNLPSVVNSRLIESIDTELHPHALIQQLRAEIELLRAIVRRYQERDDYQAQRFTQRPCVCEICAVARPRLEEEQELTL